jgi:hypothetical protein
MANSKCDQVHITALKCRSCGTRSYKPPVYMVKLTTERDHASRLGTPDDVRYAKWLVTGKLYRGYSLNGCRASPISPRILGRRDRARSLHATDESLVERQTKCAMWDNKTRRNGPQDRPQAIANLFKSMVTMAGCANPVVAGLRNGFQVMRFRGAVSLVRCVRQFLDVGVPVLVTRPRRNHQRVRGLRQRCRGARCVRVQTPTLKEPS